MSGSHDVATSVWLMVSNSIGRQRAALRVASRYRKLRRGFCFQSYESGESNMRTSYDDVKWTDLC
jgi:hypothetical protein